MRQRARAQNVIEFGVSIAAVAFVALIGFNALGSAQAAYWGPGGIAPSLAAPVPVTGDFLHPTAMSAPNCGPTTLEVGTTQYSCTLPTVSDVYSDKNERKPPQGYIGLHIDSSLDPVAVCQLTMPAGDHNSCSSLTWTPNDTTLEGQTHDLTLWYECPGSPPSSTCEKNYPPGSNHQPSQSASQPVHFLPTLRWAIPSPACVNDVTAMAPFTVEVGHPLRCGITLQDVSNGTPQPMVGTSIVWTVTSSPTDEFGMFTCATTTPAALFVVGSDPNNNCPPPPATQSATPGPTITCVADANGTCYVVFRELFANGVTHPLNTSGAAAFTVAALSIPPTDYASIPGGSGISVVPPQDSHPSGVVAVCSNGDPSYNPTNSTIPFGQEQFPITQSVDIVAVSQSATLSCSATVFDAVPNNNPVVDNSPGSNPNKQESFPPMGTVTFTWTSGSTTCQLTRQDTPPFVQPPFQDPGQAPFFSTCRGPVSIPLDKVKDGDPISVTVSYSGETVGSGLPGHQPAPTFGFPVDFK